MQVRMGTLEETVEFVKSTPHRMKSSRGSQMPFTKQGRSIAGGLQAISDRCFVHRKACLAMDFQSTDVEFMSESLRIATGHQSGPGGTAIGTGDVRISEPYASRRQGIDIRCGDVFAAVDTDVRISQVVGDDQDDVGRSDLHR